MSRKIIVSLEIQPHTPFLRSLSEFNRSCGPVIKNFKANIEFKKPAEKRREKTKRAQRKIERINFLQKLRRNSK